MKEYTRISFAACLLLVISADYCYADGGIGALRELGKLYLIFAAISAPLSVLLPWRLSKKYKKKWVYVLIPVFFFLFFASLFLLFNIVLYVLEGL
jgi:hypothetical protein